MDSSVFQLRTRRLVLSCALVFAVSRGSATEPSVSPTPTPLSVAAPTPAVGTTPDKVTPTDPDDALIVKSTAELTKTPKSMAALFTRAAAYEHKGRYDDAIRDFTKVLEITPENAGTRLRRANVYRRKKAFAEALADIDTLALVSATKADFYRIRGLISVDIGEYAKALDDFEQAVRADTKNPSPENTLAWYLAVVPDDRVRDGKKADAHIRRCLSISEKDAYIDTLAAVHAELGDFDRAIVAEQKALEGKVSDLDGAKQRLELYKAHKPYRLPVPDAAAIEWDQKRNACFDLVWTTVDQEYFDTHLEVDWREMRDRYRLPLSNAKSDEELRGVLQSMLNELHRTHFAIVPRSSAVFSPEERVRQGTVGARLAYVDQEVIVASVEKDSAAEKASLLPGDAILSLNGITLASVKKALEPSGLSPARIGLYLKESLEGQLGGKVGSELKLVVSGIDKKERNVTLKCAAFDGIWSEPVGNFPSEPIYLETVRHDDGIAYVRFNTFALPIVKPLKTFFRGLGASDGLIIDLRGNPGGALVMAPGLTGWLSAKEFSLGTVHLRENTVPLDVYPQSRAFTGPIAVLIDGSSASTSEVFAGGLRELKRARIFGGSSAGAALPSSYKRLPNDDLFQYAIGDIRTPSGHLLEGEGVAPDEEVKTTRQQYAQRDDPVVAAATRWLNEQRHSAADKTTPSPIASSAATIGADAISPATVTPVPTKIK